MGLRKRMLDIIQSGFPLEPDPYAVLAAQLDAPRASVIDALDSLFQEGTVRRVGASFSSAKLGYASTLCAAAVEPSRLEETVEVINSYPGVTHNYHRENRYNVWFTLIAPSPQAAEAVLTEIRAKTGCADILNLPATRLFKIRVDFGAADAAGTADATDAAGATGMPGSLQDPPQHNAAPKPFDAADPHDVQIVRWAQGDILRGKDGQLLDRPFAALEGEGLSQEAVISRLRELKADGTIRRFGAIVRHQNLGYSHNGMTVWDVPDAAAQACGDAFAGKRFVSHCYERPRAQTWPYNLYAMVHAQSADELDERVAELKETCPDAGEPLVLVSTQEYKKASMRYFE